MDEKVGSARHFHEWLTWGLRKLSYRWPPRAEAMRLARIERGLYRCNKCTGSFGRKMVRVDHISPIVDPVVGFTTWDDYINRLFCPAEGLQILCKPCHKEKTAAERKQRRQS